MKGKVKTSTEEVYDISYDEKGKEIREFQEKRVFKFNKNGELTTKTILYGKKKDIFRYKGYDNFRPFQFEREFHDTTAIEKDSLRLITADKYTDYLISWIGYNTDHARIDSARIKYYYLENDIEPLNGISKLRINEIYDEKGNLVQERRYLRERLRRWYEDEYNEDNLHVKRQYLEHPSGDLPEYEFTYDKFDKKGNWREKKTWQKEYMYNPNSSLITTRIILRQLSYY